jgi:hypothetical protein
MIGRLKPGDSAFVSGDYGFGKTTIIKAAGKAVGRAAFWAAPQQAGAPAEYSDIAVVVHSVAEMEKACRRSAFVVWPSPPSSVGLDAMREAFNDFCRTAMRLRGALVGLDEIQRLLGDSKRLVDAPPAFQDLVELGHKEPNRLIKVYGGHRQAQIPLALAGGAHRVSVRPFPGDEDALTPFFGRECVAAMKSFQRGDFAWWSQEHGAVWPCRLNLTSGGRDPPVPPGAT